MRGERRREDAHLYLLIPWRILRTVFWGLSSLSSQTHYRRTIQYCSLSTSWAGQLQLVYYLIWSAAAVYKWAGQLQLSTSWASQLLLSTTLYTSWGGQLQLSTSWAGRLQLSTSWAGQLQLSTSWAGQLLLSTCWTFSCSCLLAVLLAAAVF